MTNCKQCGKPILGADTVTPVSAQEWAAMSEGQQYSHNMALRRCCSGNCRDATDARALFSLGRRQMAFKGWRHF